MMYWTFSSQCIVGIWSLTLVHNLEHIVQWWIICCGGYCHWSHFTSLSIDLFFCLFSHFGFYFFLHLEIPNCFASKLCIPKNCWASGMSCITTHLLFCDPIWIQCQESHNRAQMSSSLLLLQCTQPFRDALSLLTVEYHKIQIYLVKKITPYTNSSNYLIVTGQHQLVSEPVHCSDYPNILKSTIPLSLRTEHEVNHQKNLYSQQIQCSTCKLFGYCQYFLVQTSNGKVCTHESFLQQCWRDGVSMDKTTTFWKALWKMSGWWCYCQCCYLDPNSCLAELCMEWRPWRPSGMKTLNKPSQFTYSSLICHSREVHCRASMPLQKP